MAFRVVVLASGTGSLLQALIDACRDGRCSAQIVAVGTDNPGAQALDRARNAGIDTFCCPMRDPRSEWDTEITDLVAGFEPDLVVSAGFMKILGPAFLDRFAGRCINSHPALLPSFPGAHAVRDALHHGVKVSGASIFLVDAGIDTGEIIEQRAVRVELDDTEESLHERIKVVEREMLVDVVTMISDKESR